MAERLAIAFFVPGRAVGQPRPRARAFLARNELTGHYMRDKFGRPVARAVMYDPGDSDQWKASVAQLAKIYAPKDDPFDGPVHVRLEFRLERPKSHYRTGKFEHLVKKDAPLYHTATPDIDNMAKAVLDAMKGIMWVDDSQVCFLETWKFYSPSPGVLVEVEPLGMSDGDEDEAEQTEMELAE